MERLYVAMTGDSGTIYHRPTFQYIESCSRSEMRVKLKKLLAMNTEDFYKYMKEEKGVRLYTRKQWDSNLRGTDEQEKWYQGAWKSVTNHLLKELKLKMVEENVPYDYIEQLLLESKKQTTWGESEKAEDEVSSTNEITDLINSSSKSHKKVVKKKSQTVQQTAPTPPATPPKKKIVKRNRGLSN
jgi:3-polyprenyl-4-hydroxybenzoate decarboxylase